MSMFFFRKKKFLEKKNPKKNPGHLSSYAQVNLYNEYSFLPLQSYSRLHFLVVVQLFCGRATDSELRGPRFKLT